MPAPLHQDTISHGRKSSLVTQLLRMKTWAESKVFIRTSFFVCFVSTLPLFECSLLLSFCQRAEFRGGRIQIDSGLRAPLDGGPLFLISAAPNDLVSQSDRLT